MKGDKIMNCFYPEGKLYKQNDNKKCLSTLGALADAQIRETVLEAPVIMCDTEHNLIVDLGCIKGIIPRSEGALGIEEGTTRDIA
jgi:small subunit ribosomal protein S1